MKVMECRFSIELSEQRCKNIINQGVSADQEAISWLITE
jgi:hypothetical protein